MDKQFVDTVSVYITHTCGMACSLCATYNNYTVKGHYDWKSAESRMFRWGELLDIRQITIIGGEPLLHPDVDTWVRGTVDAFKDCDDIVVFTGLTGKKLLKYKDLIRQWFEIGVSIQISVHDKNDYELSRDTARKILEGLDYEEKVGVDHCSFDFQKIEYFYKDKLVFKVYEQWDFFPHSLKEIIDGKIYMHENDPALAHSMCHCRDCHYIVDGYIYKCALTGVAEMIIEQLPIGDRERDILSKVQPLDPFVVSGFNLSNPIPQCTLCSVKTDKLIPIYPISIKKPKLIK